MAIILEEQFYKLKNLLFTAKAFYWGGGEEYTGHLNPTGIVVMHFFRPIQKSMNFLVVAEGVPKIHFPLGDEETYPSGVILAILDESFELKDWDQTTKLLRNLKGQTCPSGSAQGLCAQIEDDPAYTFNLLFLEK